MGWNAINAMFAGESSMSNMPIEPRNHYGDWGEDDPSELAALLTGNPAPKRTPGGAAVSPPESDDEVDADSVLQRSYHNPNKYGG